MSYNISSESFKNPLLKELLEKLTEYSSSINAEFYVIGATARDIIFSGIHNQVPIRTTDDLDIAIATPDWSKFDEIVEGLCEIDGFVKSKEQKQRVLFNGVSNLTLSRADDFSTIIAGASLLGRDMKVILNTNLESLKEFIALLSIEIEKEEESQLINDIMETHPSLKYEDVFESLSALTIELSK
jgi:predicted nucleotidyltransferase